VAIDNQVCLAIVTSVLTAMMLATTLGGDGFAGAKTLRPQARRQAKCPEQPDGTDRPDWTVPLFRYTAKVSRLGMRFFKHPSEFQDWQLGEHFPHGASHNEHFRELSRRCERMPALERLAIFDKRQRRVARGVPATIAGSWE